MISMLYMLIFFLTGALPWLKAATTKSIFDKEFLEIKKVKLSTTPKELCIGRAGTIFFLNLPNICIAPFYNLVSAAYNYSFYEKPDYNYFVK